MGGLGNGFAVLFCLDLYRLHSFRYSIDTQYPSKRPWVNIPSNITFSRTLCGISTSSATPPLINATTKILDHNGVDISSYFKVMVFRQPAHQDSPSDATVNKSVNNLNERIPTTTQFAQLVNACPPNETIVSSHCDPESGGERAMQKYIYTCRRTELTYDELTGNVNGQRPVYRIRHGFCQDDEICVTGHEPSLMACCVKTWIFDDYHIDKNGILQPMLGGAIFSLDNLLVYAAVSKEDASTSVEMSSMNVDTWNNQEIADDGIVQSKRCRNCMELRTDVLEPGTNSLKVQATLLTTGAAAGILWLGLMSG